MAVTNPNGRDHALHFEQLYIVAQLCTKSSNIFFDCKLSSFFFSPFSLLTHCVLSADNTGTENLGSGEPCCHTCLYGNHMLTLLEEPTSSFTAGPSFERQSFNLVFLISCPTSSHLHFGETYSKLNKHFTQHFHCVRLSYNTSVADHFSTHPHKLPQPFGKYIHVHTQNKNTWRT